ncbi:PP2C family protein-serine/threonine phosphatase [Actinomadura terrae]|uniref:PP2C family protein-serine/threonine phosphatase n=1 Tax=Actinomadura terrae TaxID=604353 RepID=UPI001FA72183|nr:SpoIIE family protein phosphatase [Actinomadura terrae]
MDRPRRGGEPADSEHARISSLLEDSAEDLYENAPCGYLSTLPDGRIAKINRTLLDWLGYRREDLVGRRSFADLLTVGGRLYHETHFAPLLRMQGEIGGIALELRAADGTRLPVMVTSTVKTGHDGEPQLIRTTVFDARDRRAYEQELLRARREAEQARAETDLERRRLHQLVATLQRTLLPPALPVVPGLDVAAHYHIASIDQVGGDFYDLFPLPGGRWGFFLGDVCGKGAGAATATSLIRYTLRAAAQYDTDPRDVLSTLNAAVHAQYHGDGPRFCTVIYGVLERRGDGFTATLASGGHPAALLIGGDGSARYQYSPDGMLVGIMDDAPFTATTIALRPGDTLVLYTDGLTEAQIIAGGDSGDASEGRYGDQALLDFAASLAPTTAAEFVAAAIELLAGFGDGLDDDTAILALSVPSGQAAGAVR